MILFPLIFGGIVLLIAQFMVVFATIDTYSNRKDVFIDLILLFSIYAQAFYHVYLKIKKLPTQ